MFSGAMVRALLNGTKTQTRRVVKQLEWIAITAPGIAPYWRASFKTGSCAYPSDHPPTQALLQKDLLAECPYGQPGDRLIVKEDAWMWCAKVVNGLTRKTKKPKVSWLEARNVRPIYCAEHPEKPEFVPDAGVEQYGSVSYEWRKKIGRFLPRWASRINLEITGIRVERLLDISDEDAIAEGIESTEPGMWKCYDDGAGWLAVDDPVLSYRTLWESINGSGSWNVNPWVWVVEFSRVKGGA